MQVRLVESGNPLSAPEADMMVLLMVMMPGANTGVKVWWKQATHLVFSINVLDSLFNWMVTGVLLHRKKSYFRIFCWSFPNRVTAWSQVFWSLP